MSRYVCYGVEYAVRFTDQKRMIIASVKQLDDRLLASKYYQARKNFYMKNRFDKTWCEKIDFVDFDLYYEEKARLNEIIDILGEHILEHGWYDVCNDYHQNPPSI